MSQLFPEVRDISTLEPVYSQDTFLDIGVEGQMDNAGSGVVAHEYVIERPGDADTLFGSASSLATLVKFTLNRGVAFVRAVPSKKGSAPVLGDRQAAWAVLEDNRDVRIRLTDSVAQADLVALADSAEFAEGVQNKQFMVGGLATGTDKATMIAAAGALNSKRGVLVGPGVYDAEGILQSGAYGAAWVAAEVSKNPDISDDLDLVTLPGSTGIEKSVLGQPLFRYKSNAGSPINDFEDLLQGGVSPLMQGRRGGAAITHLRMTFTADTTFDALMTRLIDDQVFIDIRAWLESTLKLRRPNTAADRLDIKSGVEALLGERGNWIRPREQPDGKVGYGCTVTPTGSGRGIIVHYIGSIVRNTQTIDVNGVLQIQA